MKLSGMLISLTFHPQKMFILKWFKEHPIKLFFIYIKHPIKLVYLSPLKKKKKKSITWSKHIFSINWNKYDILEKKTNRVCKDQIWLLSPKDGWTSVQRAQNNEFVENGLEKLGLNESDKH